VPESCPKSISNLNKLHWIGLVYFASSDYCGTISKGYDKLLKTIAKDAYPGKFGSKVDVSTACARFASRGCASLGAGVWRANHDYRSLGGACQRAKC
jgi:hypothetical protein